MREECWPLAVTFHPPPGPPPLQLWELQVAAADAEQTGTGSSGFDAVLLSSPLPANVRSGALDGSEERIAGEASRSTLCVGVALSPALDEHATLTFLKNTFFPPSCRFIQLRHSDEIAIRWDCSGHAACGFHNHWHSDSRSQRKSS